MLDVRLNGARICVGERFSVSFQRTLRIPEDDQTYPLPPSLGQFEIHRVEDFPEKMPAQWRQRGGFFIAMYQREALWLAFDGTEWKPNAVKVAVGGVNAISGTAWDDGLNANPQNYLVCPNQPWLDGINAGDGFIRQFVATPLGSDQTVEAQVSGREEFGGIQLVVFEPKPGKFPDQPPLMPAIESPVMEGLPLGSEMGIGAGGQIKQKIYEDPFGIETWDPENFARVDLHILNSEQYREVTGLEPPLTPVTAESYAEYHLPWFDLYDESLKSLGPSADLAAVKTLGQKDHEAERMKQTKEGRIDAKQLPVKKLGAPANYQAQSEMRKPKEK